MKYISIGAILNEGTEHILDVAHGGAQFRLTGEKARLWLNGRLVLLRLLTRCILPWWNSFSKWVW